MSSTMSMLFFKCLVRSLYPANLQNDGDYSNSVLNVCRICQFYKTGTGLAYTNPAMLSVINSTKNEVNQI